MSDESKVWAVAVAEHVRAMPANNPNSFFVVGSTFLDKNAFNRLNDDDHDIIHGIQVIYGPFDSEAGVENFVANYAGSEYYWPGHLEWKRVNAGKPYILTPQTGPNVKIVHNTSLEFQGQLELNEQQRRIREIEDMKKKLRNRELDNSKPMEKEELDVRIQWLESDLDRRRLELEQEETHMKKLLSMRDNIV